MSNLSKDSPIVVMDIDGTLACTKHRLHHLLQSEEGQKKNWKAFFEEAKHDEPIKAIVNLNKMYAKAGYYIILCTGRPANLRMDTQEWLSKQGLYWNTLLMRLTNDRGPDYVVKPRVLQEFLKSIGKSVADIELIFEDRLTVCKAWKDLGIETCVVGSEWLPK